MAPTLKSWVRALRPGSFTASLSGLVLGTALAWSSARFGDASFSWSVALLTLLGGASARRPLRRRRCSATLFFGIGNYGGFLTDEVARRHRTAQGSPSISQAPTLLRPRAVGATLVLAVAAV